MATNQRPHNINIGGISQAFIQRRRMRRIRMLRNALIGVSFWVGVCHGTSDIPQTSRTLSGVQYDTIDTRNRNVHMFDC